MSTPPTYRLRLPFTLAQPHVLSGLEQPAPVTIAGHTGTLSRTATGYRVDLGGLPSPEAAAPLAAKVWAGLAATFVAHSSAFSGSFTPQTGSTLPVAAHSDFARMAPAGLLHVVPPDGTIVFPEGVATASFQGNAPIVSNAFPASRFADTLTRGSLNPHAEDLFSDSRIRTALDLFCASYFEDSPTARFLTLSVALEALLPVTFKDPIVVQLVSRWGSELASLRSDPNRSTDEIAALDSLERELIFRRETSIRQRIRIQVRIAAIAAGHADPPALAARAVSAYDIRSGFMHTGQLDQTNLSTASGSLRDAIGVFLAPHFS